MVNKKTTGIVIDASLGIINGHGVPVEKNYIVVSSTKPSLTHSKKKRTFLIGKGKKLTFAIREEITSSDPTPRVRMREFIITISNKPKHIFKHHVDWDIIKVKSPYVKVCEYGSGFPWPGYFEKLLEDIKNGTEHMPASETISQYLVLEEQLLLATDSGSLSEKIKIEMDFAKFYFDQGMEEKGKDFDSKAEQTLNTFRLNHSILE